jgi:single-stranded-DNA-specific exonuclease
MLTLNLEPPRAAQKPFLGVVRSVRGFTWFDRLPLEAAPIAAAISQRHALHELLGRILASRGIGIEDVPDIMNPTLKRLLPDPASLVDMERAAARLARAILKGERVAVFGDYDVDGASSAALLKRFFAAHGREARIYIPDRLTEGYGPNEDAIAGLIDSGAQVIVTVDCGTTGHGPLELAASRGVDVIVSDHHQTGAELPQVHALVNPNRQDDLSGQGHLSAAGVTFLLLVATTRKLRQDGMYANGTPEPDLMSWLDIVALATVCDVVPIAGVNRAFISQGLKIMRKRLNLGLKALGDAAQLNTAPTPYHLGFVFGPRINAGGRIGNASLGAKLLSTMNDAEAREIAGQLDGLNRERQDMEAGMLAEAMMQAEALLHAKPAVPLIVASSPSWHKGVIGLLASRLTEQWQRPSLVIAWDEALGEGTGSARSVAGVDIGAAVREAVTAGCAKKGGGHTMAAGITVERARWDECLAVLETQLNTSAAKARQTASLDIDGVLTAKGATHELVEEVEKCGPYGSGNPNPRFVLPMHRIGPVKLAGRAHLRCQVQSADGTKLDAVAFRANETPLGDALMSAKAAPMHLAGRLNRDTWGGRDRIEFIIEDIADPAAQQG